MKQNVTRRSRLGVVILLIMALVVGALVVVALQKGSDTAASAPRPSVSSQPLPAAPIASPSLTAPPVVAREEERLLAIGDGVVWRGVTGSCVDGVEPLLERSTNDGATWTDVTPRYRGVSQVLRVDPFAGTQANLVVTLDAETCEPQGLRTFSDGAYWADQTVPDGVVYLAADGGLRDGEVGVEAPCAEPRSVRGREPMAVLLCDGKVLVSGETDWEETGLEHATAVFAGTETVVAAHSAVGCDGLAISTVASGKEPVLLSCEKHLDPSLATAVAVSGDRIAVWNGDALTMLASAVAE
ncbi:hypothetical protein [Microbacterium gubbeenense]|uniref:hypothetical protein n=2 Tax=Microbacterium gubbeenense TaxID=159896 RepID=UPI003F9B8ABE